MVIRLLYSSPCIDSGDNTAVPGSVTTDLDGKARFRDDPATSDTGYGTPPIADMGPYEFNCLYIGDFEGDDCDVDYRDFARLAGSWLMDDPAIDIAPIGGDGIIDIKELLVMADHWLEYTTP